MIKKEIHFFWGSTPMSWMRFMTLFSFRKHNPDWHIVLHICYSSNIKKKTWIDSPKQDFFNYGDGVDYIGQVESIGVELQNWDFDTEVGGKLVGQLGPSHMSNFFKWKLLANDNVFYSDLDILYVKPIFTYYEKVKDQDTVICYRNGHFSIGFMASSGNNKFYQTVFENGQRCCTPKYYQSAGVSTLHNALGRAVGIAKGILKHNLWPILEENFPGNHFNNTMDIVYPWKYNNMKAVFLKKSTVLPDDCIGIHWYAGSEEAQEFNNKVTQKNFKSFDNTFSHFCAGITN